MNLTEQQRAVVDHRGGSLIVSAAAGAGKTAVLVQRVLSLLCDGDDPCDVTQLMIVTYTNAAAGELRARIGQALSELLARRPGDRRLRRQLALLGSAPIGTVHSFCSRLLRQNFHQAGLAADFRLADDAECDGLKDRALRQTLEELYAEGAPEFLDLADNLSDGRGDRRLESAVRELYERLRSHPDPGRWLEYAPLLAAADPDAADWCRQVRLDAAQRLEEAARQLEQARTALTGSCAEEAYGPAFDGLLTYGEELREALDGGWDGVRAALAGFAKGRLNPVRGGDKEFLDRMKRARDRFCARVEELQTLFSVSADDIRAESARTGPLTAALCRAVTRFTEVYDALKRGRNCVDFSDLEHLALGLLRDGQGAPTALARELRASLREVMVDEYQDTNEVQERIFRLVTPESGQSFFVGDVKQSIYKFRLADPAIFLDRCRQAAAAPESQTRIDLSRNFRSRPEVLALCNFVFERTMSARFGGVDYLAGHGLEAGLSWAGRCPSELWLLDGGEDEERREEREARACADRIAALLREETVDTPDGPRPARPEDVAILLSSYAGKANYFSRALEERHIPCARGGGAFFGALETAVLISYLRILDDPRQDVPLVSVLRSPLWLFTAEELARLRLRAAGDLYDALLASEEDGHCAAFLAQLRRFRALSADLSLSALLQRMYDELRAEAVFSALDGGEARGRNLRRLLHMAARFEQGGSRGVAPFLRWLDRLALQGEPEDPGAESAGVRLLSVHKSKGLEFPFVLLPDLSKKFNAEDRRQPVLFHPDLGVGFTLRDRAKRTEWPTRLKSAIAGRMEEEARAEELRKLYVAMTRARQKLILVMSCADPARRVARVAEEAGDGAPSPVWLRSRDNAMDWLLAALLPHPDAGALRGLADEPPAAAPGERGMLDCHVLTEPAPAVAAAVLDGPAEEAAVDYEPYMARAEQRYAHLDAAALPSKLTPTGARRLLPENGELGGTPEKPEARMWRQDAVTPRTQKRAAQRGTALHLLLRYTDPARCRTAEDAAALLTELVRRGLMTEEQAALCDPGAALGFARSPLGRRTAAAPRVLREYEFGVLLPADELLPGGPAGERLLMNGAIDLMLFEEDGLTLVDFKSDRVQPGREAEKAREHRLQLRIYAPAAEEIFGLPVRETAIWFLETGAYAVVERGESP